MRHFEYDDDEFKKDVDKFWEDNDDDDDDFEELMYQGKDVIHAIEMQLAEKDLDLKLLKIIIKMHEKSFWWKFYNFQTRLKVIAKSYLVFFKLMDKTREAQDKEG